MPALSSIAKLKDRNMPTVTLEYVTPELAASWLEHNVDNRNLRKGHVDTLARIIERGDFLVTGETVKFDWNGNLIDAQHRLHACVQASQPIWIFVVRNLNPDVRVVIDTQTKRSAADALKYAGMDGANRNVLSAAIRMAIHWDEGIYTRAGSYQVREVDHTEIVRWLKAHPSIGDSAEVASRLRSQIPTIPPSPMAFAHYLFSQIDRAEADRFFDDLANLRTSGKGDPLFTLLRRCETARGNGEKLRAQAHLSFLIRAWNARRAGQPLHVLKVGAAGKNGVIGMPRPR